MAIGGIGGNEPIKEVKGPQSNNEVITRNQISADQISIFNKCDTDGNGKLEGAETKSFKSMIADFKNKLMGGVGKAESKPTGTTEDVKNATNQTNIRANEPFNEDGSYRSDVNIDERGNKTIKAGNDTLYVAASGNQLKVTNTDGKSAELVKTGNGYEFKDEDGKLYKFDKDMNLLN